MKETMSAVLVAVLAAAAFEYLEPWAASLSLISVAMLIVGLED